MAGHHGDVLSLWGILGLATLFGALTGTVALSLWSVLWEFIGMFLGGLAIGDDVKVGLTWSIVPTTAGLLVIGTAILLFGLAIFQSEEMNREFWGAHEGTIAALGYFSMALRF